MGVKSLWKLVGPVGRPVMLETLEGQILAIDSSIWIYQFQATMRDKDGRALSNAHVLGFLRRIAKLLFYGIKPVFVFDGGAPAMKRNTLNERRQKKSGAATSHAKLAEKLLAAQMRREAVKHAQGKQKPKSNGKFPTGPVVLDDNTVYLEDIDGSAAKSPAKNPAPPKSASASPSKPRFHEHDPYRLPDVDFEAAVAKATRAAVPDPRLATEDELRAFIEDMRPEDFDITSPAFRELPTEVQYEIVGDLRLKSRQTSFARLQNMLSNSKSPLDFSKQQILNLRQRNTLTQQLLETTDSIGKAHLTIPVRVASERNREYLLIKNEGKDGGWILGIRDDGTKEKPIEIDQDSEKAVSDADSDEDMEEVAIPFAGVQDPDLQEYQRSNALDAISKRHAPKKSLPKQSNPLFDFDAGDFDLDDTVPNPVDDDDDEGLAFAIQESLDNATAVPAAPQPRRPVMVNAVASSSKSTLDNPVATPRRSSDTVRFSLDEEYIQGNRLETALSIANAGPVRTPVRAGKAPMSNPNTPPLFGKPMLLQSSPEVKDTAPKTPTFGRVALLESGTTNSPPLPKVVPALHQQLSGSSLGKSALLDSNSDVPTFGQPVLLASSRPSTPTETVPLPPNEAVPFSASYADSDEEMEEVLPSEPIKLPSASPQDEEMEEVNIHSPSPPPPPIERQSPLPTSLPASPIASDVDLPDADADVDETPLFDWSRSPTPVVGLEEQPPRAPSPVHPDWDAAQEMDPAAEESEFAQFMSQVKGKELGEVQREIDDEIQVLNAQKRAALRDAEDVNHQMVSQIMMMLSLFGIPYITAPMEAEAQCAELVQLGLVNGVITDDSDVFLFGGLRVYKNMFNQSKTVECFLMSDLARELGLERDALVRLAYLLGSDYVEGLPGVGPVVAMELLGEFPGDDGLHKFKDWWSKVQSGKDKPEESSSKFRKRFKKNFKKLYLPPEWPNPLVRDAYYHPTVDESEETFKWGLPDLDALREFLFAELAWKPDKVDELLLPVIQKMRKRAQSGAPNKQGNLNGYFDVGGGSGTIAPRKRQAYASKRLQQVVSDFRKKRKRGSKSLSPAQDEDEDRESADEEEEPVKKPAKRSKGKEKEKEKPKTKSALGRKPPKKRKPKKSKNEGASESEGSDFEGVVNDAATAGPPQLRPRPKPTFRGAQQAEEQDQDDR
ncbi:hypothetical protein MKEN_00347600 [Mycena kentingensis (nom. inval.)]|nr:hypothetical protein MKEN_00347600 [Mycena kentingensis (nom. inval.)]